MYICIILKYLYMYFESPNGTSRAAGCYGQQVVTKDTPTKG
jgi:hypothetical protein